MTAFDKSEDLGVDYFRAKRSGAAAIKRSGDTDDTVAVYHVCRGKMYGLGRGGEKMRVS